MRVPRAVFFDLDGCLVDSRAAISRCLNIGLEAVGAAPRPEAELYHFIGPPLHESFVSLLTEGQRVDDQVAEDRAARCVDAYREAYTELSLTDTARVEGIEGPLEELADLTTLAVVTSKPADFAAPILEAVGLADRFVAVHAPDLTVRAEAKALTLARALEDVAPGAAPRGTAMVGDRRHDVDAGRACGTRTVGVLWGIGDAAELTAADAVAGRPEELVGALLG